MNKSIIATLLICLALHISHTLYAQELPRFININENQTEIKTASGEVTGFYNESKLRRIDLIFELSNYWSLLESYYDTENYVKASLVYEGDTLENVGVQFKGNTSYTRLEDGDEKMSFSIKTDQFVEDQDLEGYSNLNLNNAYQDHSTMREVLYAHLCRQHIPAPQANFIELYINGQFWGPYANVQQVNKDMLEEWFLSNDGARFRAVSDSLTSTGGGGGPRGGGGGNWGDGTSALNYLGSDTTEYQKYYTLKSSDITQEWEKLIALCDVLNNTPIDELETTLKNYLDIDRTLWFLAHEIIYSDDDSYIFKGKQDYYVYYEPETGRFTPLEFDGNSALGLANVRWNIFTNSDDVNYPLLNLLLSIPDLRQRYLAHVRTILDEEMNLEEVFELIDTYQELIEASVNDDPKKLMTYQEFLTGVTELKDYFTQRSAFLLSDLEVDVAGVAVGAVTYVSNDQEGVLPYDGDEMVISVSAGTTDIEEVNLYYAEGFVGNFTKIQMMGDEAAGDGLFSATIPGHPQGVYIRYYIEAKSNNSAKTASYLPEGAEHSSFIYRVQFSSSESSDIVINELLASNNDVIEDEMGESADYIELYNRSNESVSLEGYFLSDDAEELNKFALPTMTLDAGAYYLVWADGDVEEGDNHASFKLSAEGEELYLVNLAGEIVDDVAFSDQSEDISYGRFPNGTGSFAFMTPTPSLENGELLEEETEEVLSSNDAEVLTLTMYPNPVNDRLTITFDTGKAHSLEIYSLLGQKMASMQVEGASTQLDVGHWQPGIYMVRIDHSVLTLRVE